MNLRTRHLLKGKTHLIRTGFIWQVSDGQAEGKTFHGLFFCHLQWSLSTKQSGQLHKLLLRFSKGSTFSKEGLPPKRRLRCHLSCKKITRFPRGKTGPLGKLAEISQHCAETKTKTPARKRHLCTTSYSVFLSGLNPVSSSIKKGSQQRLSHRSDKWSKIEPRKWGPIAEFLTSCTPYFSW